MMPRLLLTLAFLLSSARAAAPATGALEGRVLNAATGEYLERARVTIDGTALEAFTDDAGRFAFPAVPPGSARVRITFTGLAPETASVAISSSQTATHDFTLTRPGAPVQLAQVTVATSREIDGAAIAINEKRYAADLRNVIAADEFGPMADGNIGELLKHVPGVALDYVGGAAMNISLNGVPSGYVPVTMNGFPLASTTATSPTARDVELVNVATNNLARIEVLHAPTPESPGHALAGSVNLVPRSAFERARPQLQANLYALLRDDVRTLSRTPGPTLGRTRKILPGLDFSYVAPVSKKFGFTLSGGTSQQYQPTYFVQTNWRGVNAPTNVAASATTGLPATTPDKPYLTDYLIRDQPRQSRRSSASVTLDWKFTRTDRVSVSLQATRFDAHYNQRDLTFSIARVLPGNFSTEFTRGAAGFGTLTLANANDRDRRNASLSPSLVWRHDGPVWKLEAGAGWSLSTSEIRDQGKGFFNSVTATRTGLTLAFEDIYYLGPRRIVVTDATGAPVDPHRLAGYRLQTAGGNRYGADTVLGRGPGEGINNATKDTARNAYAHARRTLPLRVPVTLKAGLDLRQSIRDYRGGTSAHTFVGPDGVANSADDSATPYLDPIYSARDGVFGFPRTERVGGGLLYEALRQHPAWFAKNDNTIYRSAVNLSKRAEEIVSSGYVRADAAFFERRLRLMGGFRVEQTNIRAEGPLTDPTGNFQRRPDGSLILGANGRPLPIAPATDALAVSRLTFLDRGYAAKKEYLHVLPRLTASYNLRENLIARVAYSHALGRPNYNQYAGGLTLPDETSPPSPANRITVNNVALKPWTARSVQVSLERYFEGVGLVSAGAFRREARNFSGAILLRATPELLASYDLDPAVYGGYDVATQFNLPGTVRSEGFDVSYKQALTFLPAWARGVNVFANGAITRFTGAEADNFQNFIPKTASWGASLNREGYVLRVNWNYKARHRRAAIAPGASIEPGTYAWGSKRLFVDVIGEWRLARGLALFANLRNIGDTPEDFSREGPSTPAVAQFRQRDRYGALWMFGVKGTF